MADKAHISPGAEGQAADDPDYLHLVSLFSTFHISDPTKATTSKKGMNSLPAEIIIKIASYFYDDYIFCKLTDNLWIESDANTTNQTLGTPNASTSATTPPPSQPTFYHICPYAAFAMTNRYLWTVIQRPLSRPIPLEIIEEAEVFLRVARCETGDHWARKFGRMRGAEMTRWKGKAAKHSASDFPAEGESKYGAKLYDWDDY